MFSATLTQCFDSHLHWQATGDWSHRLFLNKLTAADDVALLKIEAAHFRGEWLTGFGWDQNNFLNKTYPDRQSLDKIFPDVPVAFSRADGHATWVNTVTLKKIGLLSVEGAAIPTRYEIKGGKVLLDKEGLPTGVLLDNAKALVDQQIPKPTGAEVRRHLLEGMRIFHSQGVTHIRDMTCNEVQWEQALHLDEAGLLKLGVLQTFSAEDPKDFHKALKLANSARKQKTQHLKPQSIKIFYDGALGSEGALLSKCYCSGSGHGFRLLEPQELKEVLKETWDNKWDLAVHTIGDQAVDEVVEVATTLWNEGFEGRLHLEHAELIRDETLLKMKGRNLICHLQPCHWLSDRKWARRQLGDLANSAFPWRKLEELQIPFYFGSDSPIEPVSVALNLEALDVAKQDGIASMKGDPLLRHQLGDPTWTPNTYTIFEEGKVKELVFEGTHLV